MKYKLFISDYDGTLGRKDYVDPSTLEAIKEYERRGGKFIICSGRIIESIIRICKYYGFKGVVGCYQGATLVDIDSGEMLYDFGVDKDIALSVMKDFVDEGFDFTVDLGGKRYCRLADDVYMGRYEKFGGSVGVKVSTEELFEIVKNTTENVEKVCAMLDPKLVYPKIEEYNAKYPKDVSFNSGGSIILECINSKFDKGYAVKEIAKYYGVPLDQVITIGDSTNDVPLVSGPWHGVAVGSGCDQVKAAADEIANVFDENPVKQMLEKYCL